MTTDKHQICEMHHGSANPSVASETGQESFFIIKFEQLASCSSLNKQLRNS